MNSVFGGQRMRGHRKDREQNNLQNMLQYMMQLFQTLISLFQGTSGQTQQGGGTTPLPADDASTTDTAESPSGADDSSGETSIDGSSSDVSDPSVPDNGDASFDDPKCGCVDNESRSITRRGLRNLSAQVKDGGQVEVKTKDGYIITCEGKDQAWTITSPSGKVTRIWGDPHVNESDGDTWDFTKQSSFRFGRNKVTVEVTPYGDGDATLSRTITIYNGNDRITISGIDQNKPYIAVSTDDAKEQDAQLEDGDTYRLRKETNGDDEWRKVAP